MKLVLFDIDGTLLWTDGAGRRAMEGALTELFGTAGDPSYRYDGKTDRQIAREQMRAAGFHEDIISERIDRVIDSYVARLEEALTLDHGARSCYGVCPLLDELRARSDVILGLLTGNVERGAKRKLNYVGIDFDQFRVNAFGCDSEHRPDLPAVAQKRARERAGVEVAGPSMVIIGDTPADIECGRSLGVRAIGVATGRFTVTQLAGYQPAAVFETLADTRDVLDAIIG